MEIEIPMGYKVKWVNGVLTLVHEKKKDNRPVAERIKTFDDAVEELGNGHPLCVHYFEIYDNFLFEGGNEVADVVAFLKLRIIVAALNEGWVPTPKDSGYSPEFMFHTADEMKAMADDDIPSFMHVLEPKFDVDLVTVSCPCATVLHSGSCMLLRTPETAIYCGQQFIDIWMDYLLPIKEND